MRTRARKSGKEYILNGEKMWITSGTIADVAIIWAKVEDEDDKIRGFLVETTARGSRQMTSTENGRCAPRSLRGCRCRTFTSRSPTCCR